MLGCRELGRLLISVYLLPHERTLRGTILEAENNLLEITLPMAFHDCSI